MLFRPRRHGASSDNNLFLVSMVVCCTVYNLTHMSIDLIWSSLYKFSTGVRDKRTRCSFRRGRGDEFIKRGIQNRNFLSNTHYHLIRNINTIITKKKYIVIYIKTSWIKKFNMINNDTMLTKQRIVRLCFNDRLKPVDNTLLFMQKRFQ